MVRDQRRNNIVDVTGKLTILHQNKKIISISLHRISFNFASLISSTGKVPSVSLWAR